MSSKYDSVDTLLSLDFALRECSHADLSRILLLVAALAILPASAATAVESIGGAKQMQVCQEAGGVGFVCSVTIYVENLGDVLLGSVQATEDLFVTFPAPATFSVSPGSVSTTGGLSANPGFDGVLDTNLLSGTDTLAAGVTATIGFDINVNPNGTTGHTNIVVVIGEGPGGIVTTDNSDNGTIPDSNGDGFANGPGEDDPTPVIFPAQPVPGLSTFGLWILTAMIILAAALVRAHLEPASSEHLADG